MSLREKERSSIEKPTSEDGEPREENFDGFDDENQQPTTCMGKFLKGLKDNLFMILILVGVAVGFGLGFGLRAATDSPIAVQWMGKLSPFYKLYA